MPYNDVGGGSVRGTGTSGFLQSNLASSKHNVTRPKEESRHAKPPMSRPVDPLIAAHERARKVESRIYEYRKKLEEQGIAGDEMQSKLHAKRIQVEENLRDLENRQNRISQHQLVSENVEDAALDY